MRKFLTLTEAVITSLEPRRVGILAEECLLAVRFVESHSEDAGWCYEYEVSGEVGKVEKFLLRIKDIEKKRG
ncbi:MAG: hypothetical protein H6Q72_1161 [Firmicutes bacterium]|nr:hypothetical protein [Bacillota bacterium]